MHLIREAPYTDALEENVTKQRSSGLSDLEYDIVKREYDEKYELVVPMSLVRLGFTDKELAVKRSQFEAMDYCFCR